MTIPDRFRARCDFCGDELDIRRPGVFVLKLGWVKNRSQGGGNALALPKSQGRYACMHCIDRQQHKLSPFQAQLFG